jgi:hypothetical protein
MPAAKMAAKSTAGPKGERLGWVQIDNLAAEGSQRK